jgi:hypothetical protein
MPFEVAGSAYDDVRILVAAILIIPPFYYFQPKNRLVQLLPAITFSVIALVNIGTTARVWLSFDPEFAALKSSFSMVRGGAFVLIAKHDQPSDLIELPLHHAPVLAVHYAGAFVPSLWSIPGMYVVQPSPTLRSLNITGSNQNGAGRKGPLPFRVLKAVADGQVPSDVPSFVRCWTYDFDYLYLIGPPVQNPLPARLVALANGSKFTLYRILHFDDNCR